MTFILIILALGVGLALWQNRAMPPVVRSVSPAASAPQAATPPALAASDAAATPAPQPAPAPAAQADEEPTEYTVQHGDTLGKVATLRKDLKDQWKALCYENRKELKYGCHDIRKGMVLSLVISDETKAALPKVPAAFFRHGLKPRVRLQASTPVARATAPVASRSGRLNAAGELIYDRVGRAPLNECGRRDILSIAEEAWQVLGLPEGDRAWLRLNIDAKNGPQINDTDSVVKLVPGMRLEQVTFCRDGKVVAVGPVRTAWSPNEAVYGQKFVLPSGRTVVWMRNCFNWVPWIPEKQRDIPGPGQTTGTLGGDPVIPPPPPLAPTLKPPAITEAPKSLCERVEPEVALGQHIVPQQNGDRASSDFLTFVLDCQRRLASDDGSWGVGVKGNYSDWKGTANRGAGQFRGHNYLSQLSYRQVMDEGYNWNVGVGAGRQHESYRQGAYASQTTYDLVGVTAAYNDYRRRMAGETWNVEQQYFAGITVPTASSVSQTWFGQSVDSSGMPRLKLGVQAGGRWWVYEDDDIPVLPFIEAGLFVQHPTSASANLLAGIADRNRICGIGPGLDKDLQHGGSWVKAWGWFCDPFQGGRVAREKARREAFIEQVQQAGGSVDKNGMIRLPSK